MLVSLQMQKTQRDPEGPSKTLQDPVSPSKAQKDKEGPRRTQKDPEVPVIKADWSSSSHIHVPGSRNISDQTVWRSCTLWQWKTSGFRASLKIVEIRESWWSADGFFCIWSTDWLTNVNYDLLGCFRSQKVTILYLWIEVTYLPQMSTLLRADQREVCREGEDLCMRKRILSPEGGRGSSTEWSRNVWSTHSAENTSGNVEFSSYI